MDKYQVHYDEDSKRYWVGVVVRYPNGSPAFVKQVGSYYIHKLAAERKAERLNKQA